MKLPKKFIDEFLKYAAEDVGALIIVLTLLTGLALSLIVKPSESSLDLYVPYGFLVLTQLTIRSLGVARRIDRLATATAEVVDDNKQLAAGVQQIVDRRQLLQAERHVRPDFMQQAQELRISGITLNRTLDDNIDHIRGTLQNGGTVRILLTAASDQLSREFPLRFESGAQQEDGEKLARRLRDARDTINRIIERDTLRPFTGVLECGVVPFMMPCGIIDVRDGRGSWRLRCEIYHRKSTTGQTAFYLDAVEPTMESWCKFFEDTFDDYWKLAVRTRRTVRLVDRRTVRSLNWELFTGGGTGAGPQKLT